MLTYHVCNRRPTSTTNICQFSTKMISCIFFLLCFLVTGLCDVPSLNFFAESFISQFGSNGQISHVEVQKLIDSLKTKEFYPGSADDSLKESCNITASENWDAQEMSRCYKYKCLSAVDIFELENLSIEESINATVLGNIVPTILFEAQKIDCMNSSEVVKGHVPPTQAEVWGYSFLFVTAINLCSLIGVGVMPFMKKQGYHVLLMFFVALAVGTLAGSGLLFLIPDSFGLLEIEEEHGPVGNVSFVYKALTVLGGIYLFFLVERILKIIMDWREKKSGSEVEGLNDLPICSLRTHTDLEIDPEQKIPPNIGKQQCTVPRTDSINDKLEKYDVVAENHDEGTTQNLMTSESVEEEEEGQPRPYSFAHFMVAYCNTDLANNVTNAPNDLHCANQKPNQVTDKKDKQQIAPVAWMIIFGDALHNFIDGLSIGAAFSEKTLAGISVSLAVLCEEFPHELGDFAILLNSGMTIKQALAYNFLSACSCYLGLVIGILLGEMTSASKWIFALAGGMFLYIALADMMPEVNHASESKETKMFKMSPMKIFIIQNLGLIAGFGSMFLLAVYGGQINLG